MTSILHRDRPLKLTFCSNVLPGQDAATLMTNLQTILPGVRERFEAAAEASLGLGLWLPAAMVEELGAAEARHRFEDFLREQNLEIFTLNAFPFGDFHGRRVKRKVFEPAWDDPARLHYTLDMGRLLARWTGECETASISTLALGWKVPSAGEAFRSACALQLMEVALQWHQLAAESGKILQLGLEPEPGSELQTTGELIDFFREYLLGETARKWFAARGISSGFERCVLDHLGICYDLCHQAVEFEDMQQSFDNLVAAGIPIVKLQITNALEIREPGKNPEGLRRLREFAEPRYLHQVARPGEDGSRARIASDLEELLAGDELESWLQAPLWRIHFHVPVQAESISGLHTTRDFLLRGLRYVLDRDLCRHLEVETYTWGVLPEESREGLQLANALGEELDWTHRRIQEFEAAAGS